MTHENDDPLVRSLRELPVKEPSSPGLTRGAARAAFVRAFEKDASWSDRALAAVGRAAVPVVLASVVGLYLFWAFTTAIALVR